MHTSNQSFLVHKTELKNTKISESEKPELKDGEVLLEISKYAFTSNNITYGVIGHKLGYWNFFPAEEPYGIIPVWGYANVVASKHDGVNLGDRFYGYFPMSKFLKVTIGKNSPYGFVDMAEHRQQLSPIYNYYINSKTDPSYDAAKEDYAPIIRPLFVTSFLSYNFLKSENFFDASQIIITSASSKTSLGLAYSLKKNQEVDGKKIIGLTSARNVEFVKNTGYYDQVIAYDDIEKELPNNTSTIVDMAGNSSLLTNVSTLLGDNLKFISLIGLTDWTADKEFKTLPNSKFFFAPTFAQKLFAEMGQAEANKKIAIEMAAFIENMSQFLTIKKIETSEALSALYLDMLKGKVDPSIGYLVCI